MSGLLRPRALRNARTGIRSPQLARKQGPMQSPPGHRGLGSPKTPTRRSVDAKFAAIGHSGAAPQLKVRLCCAVLFGWLFSSFMQLNMQMHDRYRCRTVIL